jgi:chorismate synthase
MDSVQFVWSDDTGAQHAVTLTSQGGGSFGGSADGLPLWAKFTFHAVGTLDRRTATSGSDSRHFCQIG